MTLYRSGPLKRKTPMKKRGKKTIAWEKTRRELVKLFGVNGTITCELRYQNCFNDYALGFMHSNKRRNIVGDELREVALGCSRCHYQLELKPESEMTAIVRDIIKNRSWH